MDILAPWSREFGDVLVPTQVHPFYRFYSGQPTQRTHQPLTSIDLDIVQQPGSNIIKWCMCKVDLPPKTWDQKRKAHIWIHWEDILAYYRCCCFQNWLKGPFLGKHLPPASLVLVSHNHMQNHTITSTKVWMFGMCWNHWADLWKPAQKPQNEQLEHSIGSLYSWMMFLLNPFEGFSFNNDCLLWAIR